VTLNAERIKLQTVRSPWWTALAVALISLGLAAIQASAALPGDVVAPEQAVIGVATFGVPVLMILSALMITGEHRTGLIRTTFLATPRRVRVLLAKATVAAVFSGIITAVLCVASVAVVHTMVKDSGPANMFLADPEVWRTVGAVTLYAVFGAILAVGLGTLVRHSVAAVAVLLLMPFVIEPLLGAAPHIGERIGPLFPFANASTFTGVPWLQTFSLWWGPVGAGLYFAVVALLVFGIAAVVIVRRDP
jgi:hypothetical protein